jgi:ABC-type transporter MlaC component
MVNPRRWWSPTPVRVLGGLLVVLSLATGAEAVAAQQASERAVNCLRTFADGASASITASRQAVEQADQAELDLFTALLNTKPTVEGQAAARQTFTDYVAAAKRSQEERKAHPLPAPPKDVCPS